MNFKLFFLQAMLLLFFYMALISSCSMESNFAPVADINAIETIPSTGAHRVSQGETLYAIAWRYGVDYRLLASQNKILPPYAIHPNQLIQLQKRNVDEKKGHSSILSGQPILILEEPAQGIAAKKSLPFPSGWVMPSAGRIFFTQNGINFLGKAGSAIYAARSGKVVYCGNGLRGYGNLIIIKHNNVYLSAYAHSKKIYVKEGQYLVGGQKIAEMGNTGTDRTMLHFEIRRAGKPINPLPLLQS